MAFLPMNAKEMRDRGWNEVDFVYVCGDSYVDHPSFGAAIITRVLEDCGYKTAFLAQPNWKNDDDFTQFGKPRLGFMVSAGNIDSMVAHYTVAKRKRHDDAYTADGKAPDVKELMQPPYFVFKTQQLSKILNAFKRTKIHLAVVTDEYGGTLGIVTMEDLLEEIVGEIWDEDEEIEHNYYKIGKGEFLVNGDMELEDMLGLFDMDEDSLECDSVTVGGYILEHAGTIPHKRDNIEADGFKFTVMEVKDQRILRVVVKKNDTSEENESDEKSENKKSE